MKKLLPPCGVFIVLLIAIWAGIITNSRRQKTHSSIEVSTKWVIAPTNFNGRGRYPMTDEKEIVFNKETLASTNQLWLMIRVRGNGADVTLSKLSVSFFFKAGESPIRIDLGKEKTEIRKEFTTAIDILKDHGPWWEKPGTAVKVVVLYEGIEKSQNTAVVATPAP